jgi:DNA gyrase subunit B
MAKQTDKAIKAAEASYGADSITVLEGLDPVRKRPGMYIGSTGTDGLHHLIKEIFDNSRDEAMAGRCNRIELTLLPDGYVRVADNGVGIPVGIHSKTGVSALQTIMTVLHAGGKFGGEGYKISGGLHGVGASVVNALSTHLMVRVHREGGEYFQEYNIGKPLADVKKVAKSDINGTIVTFKPDDTIFSSLQYNWQRIVSHYREQAYLVKGLRVTLVDARNVTQKVPHEKFYWVRDEMELMCPSQTFYFEGGVVSMVRHYTAHDEAVHKNIFYVEKQTGDMIVECALRYVDDINPKIIAFANNISTPGGGMHVTGFKTALTRLINKYATKNKVLTEKEGTFQGEDVLEGIVAVISIKMPEIQFEGQTKDKLGSPEARGAVEAVFGEAFEEFLEKNPDDAKDIMKKMVLAMRARKAAKAAKESIMRKGALEGMTLPGKLADCQSKRADESELFIVEGDSAGGTAKQGRDRRIQAILPLRGKPLNVERARLDRMLGNQEIKNMIIALGASIGDTFNIDDMRYHKIIIATDADVDGSHIRTLLLTLFYRHLRPVIDAGHIYIAQPPLYKIKHGKEFHYAYNDDEKNAVLAKLGVSNDDVIENPEEDVEPEDQPESDAKQKKSKSETGAGKKTKVLIQRYKGLGEMNSEELWETTMDPARRILKQVTVTDALIADDIFTTLMGTDVPSRKSFIQTNAKMAELDV